MSEKPTGGPAFATASPYGFQGMTLRDYFAAAALTGWIQTLGARYGQPGYSDDGAAWQAAVLAYEVADAMIAERNIEG